MSYVTAQKPQEELHGLVYGLTKVPEERVSFFKRPEVWGSIAMIVMIVLNIIFW